MATKPWSSTAPPGEFQPYTEAGKLLPEFTLRAVLLGVGLRCVLRRGLRVRGPACRAYGFRFHSDCGSFHQHPARLRRSTILENNIVQTTGSAGESVAAGVIFTIPR